MTDHRFSRLSRLVIRVLTIGILATTAQLILGTTAGADPTPTDWARLRGCESGGNYGAVAGNGHYGAYQFDLHTWASVGGASYPNRASATEQDYRALYLYRMRGWQPWQCAGSLRLRADRDAASKRVPSYPEATAVGAAHTVIPDWPGKVYAYGDCDPALRAWQLRMNSYGYTFEGTGCYYAKTREAVLALQRANGINDSGLLGPKTWRAAWQGSAPRP